MPDGISPIVSTGYIDSSEIAKAVRTASANTVEAKIREGDSVAISEQAKAKNAEAAKDEVSEAEWAEMWKTRFGFETGTRKAANGNRQEVVVKGAHLEILEYKGDRLVRKIEGEMGLDMAVMDTEAYDRGGRVEQSIHAELLGLRDASGSSSVAEMRRSIQWFEHGELVRTMDDDMELRSSYSDVAYPDGEPHSGADAGTSGMAAGRVFSRAVSAQDGGSLEAMAGAVTRDVHKTRYFAVIQDFHDGVLSQEMTIKQDGARVNETNRSTSRWEGMDPAKTRETYHDVGLIVDITNYDAEGEMVRSVRFQDEQVNGLAREDGETKQSLSVSWYNKGELVKRSHGALTITEGVHDHLETRPTILETLDLGEGEYASPRPRSAAELLGLNFAQAAVRGDQHAQTLEHDSAGMTTGSYNAARSLEKYDSGDKPYSIRWSNEIYREGELVARQEDSQSARKSPVPPGEEFRVGGGLTEDENPAVLKRSSHVDESFENGRPEKRASVESREYVDTTGDGPDKVMVHTTGEQGVGYRPLRVERSLAATLDEVDREFGAAADAFADETGLTLDDVNRTLSNLNDDIANGERPKYFLPGARVRGRMY